MTEHLPRIREELFVPSYANYFGEAELLPRAVVVVLVDLINVAVAGMTGMLILVLYHRYFLVYNSLLLGGFLLVLVVSGQGGVWATHDMEPGLRQILLRRLCSKDESWSVIFVSNDPTIGEFVDRRFLAG
ncbi:MAG: hypothetical protein KGO23_01710 [Nitrospirota bacterium]|nr:hypothetical protein [Nitrospirota bacterium]